MWYDKFPKVNLSSFQTIHMSINNGMYTANMKYSTHVKYCKFKRKITWLFLKSQQVNDFRWKTLFIQQQFK